MLRRILAVVLVILACLWATQTVQAQGRRERRAIGGFLAGAGVGLLTRQNPWVWGLGGAGLAYGIGEISDQNQNRGHGFRGRNDGYWRNGRNYRYSSSHFNPDYRYSYGYGYHSPYTGSRFNDFEDFRSAEWYRQQSLQLDRQRVRGDFSPTTRYVYSPEYDRYFAVQLDPYADRLDNCYPPRVERRRATRSAPVIRVERVEYRIIEEMPCQDSRFRLRGR